nr:N-(5'-phosphoribosyl)anthranilate isomerase [Myxococcota bacterium]
MSGSVRIKICGIRTPDEGRAAVDAGADLVGLNFVADSPRRLDLREAEAICEVLNESDVERVALFRDATWDEMDTVLRRIDVTRVQFHGDETEEDLESIDLPAIKAIR